ncbi:cell wall protein [Trichoderma gracile]
MAVRSLVATLLLASSALAKTDLAGCTYTDVVVFPSGRPSYEAYGSRIWYVPGSGELCEFLDCGGGRAPPKTTVPGCPLYSGTETYSPSYLDLHTKAAAAGEATATGSSGASTTAAGEAQVTTQPTAAPATTFETSVSETASSEASTTAVPVQSSAASSSSSSASSSTATASQGLTTGAPGRNGTVTGSRPTSTFTTNGAAAPTGAVVLGSFLMAGVAAVGLL